MTRRPSRQSAAVVPTRPPANPGAAFFHSNPGERRKPLPRMKLGTLRIFCGFADESGGMKRAFVMTPPWLRLRAHELTTSADSTAGTRARSSATTAGGTPEIGSSDELPALLRSSEQLGRRCVTNHGLRPGAYRRVPRKRRAGVDPRVGAGIGASSARKQTHRGSVDEIRFRGREVARSTSSEPGQLIQVRASDVDSLRETQAVAD